MQPTEHDVIGVLIKDHREVEEMFGQLQSGGMSADERETLTQKVVTELVRHSIAEEMYLYPTVRKSVPGGGEIADQEIKEHGEAEKTMKRLEGLKPGDPQFEQALTTLMTEIRQHVQEEEEQLFPKLAQHVSETDLKELGEKVQQAKKTAPTRPHPSAPDTPPGNKALGPFAGLVDRMRDAISGRGKG
jgi:hemerythrin superfamily protein